MFFKRRPSLCERPYTIPTTGADHSQVLTFQCECQYLSFVTSRMHELMQMAEDSQQCVSLPPPGLSLYGMKGLIKLGVFK
jgi:hypothetical protein